MTQPLTLNALKAARAAALEKAHALLLRDRNGLRAARVLSTEQDKIIIQSFKTLAQPLLKKGTRLKNAPFCLCATGGYGRGELAPNSDIDLLLLYENAGTDGLPDGLENAYTQMLYGLWDTGLKVGHALRQGAECSKIAAEDPVSATAMMDIRVLVGNPRLAADLYENLVAKASARADRDFVEAKLLERDERHLRLGESRYMVEPHVKDGKGALRDLQTLGWIARRLEPNSKNARAALSRYLDPVSLRRYDQALRFMWTVRFWLHHITARPEDRLSFDLQPELARLMGYRDTPGAERLMKAYFLKARDVGALTRIFCTQLEMIAAKRAPTGLSRFFPGRRKTLKTTGFVTEAGRLDYDGEQSVLEDPVNIIRLFETADAVGCDIHPNALRTAQRHLFLMNANFRRSAAAADGFFACLTESRNPEALLRIMSESGVLGRYIPEYAHIVGRTQFNMYHRYTVDEHTLRAVGFLHDLLQKKSKRGPDWIGPVAGAVQNRRALYLAMLLHDTGKGKGDQQIAGAKVAMRACARMGLDKAETRLVSWLIGNHLLMSDTAQLRDLNDPRTILDFAKIVQSPERLRLLLLLTIADISAVGPGVWNGWKERLLRELYEVTMSGFRGKIVKNIESLQQHAQSRANTVKESFLKTFPQKAFGQRWARAFGPSYWTAFQEETIHNQALWAAEVTKKKAPYGVFVGDLPESSATVLRILADDAPGLFAKLCGAIATAGGNITGAHVYTTRKGRAFDVFYIQGRGQYAFGHQNPRALKRLEKLIRDVLDAKPVSKVPKRSPSRRAAAFAVAPAVVFDNEASLKHTVLETTGRNRQGLLHDLSSLLWRNRLDIRSAHISTYGARAVDVFYVTEHNGQKVTNARRQSALRTKLRAALVDEAKGEKPVKIERATTSKRQ